MDDFERITSSKMKKPEFERDPFPKMIVVCIVISMVLFVFIIGVLGWDLSRDHQTPGPDMAPPTMPIIVNDAPAVANPQ